jgi:hypothetical protein
MKVSLLIEVDQQEKFNESKDLSRVFFPVGLLE